MSISKQKTSKGKGKENKSTAIRIKKNVLDNLKQEAKLKMEDVDTLVNQILRSHIQWHKLAKKARLAYISKDLMAKTIDYLSDEQVIQMTEEFCKQRFMDIIHMVREENTFACFMNALCLWLDESAFNYRVERINNFGSSSSGRDSGHINNDNNDNNDGNNSKDCIKVYKIYFDMGRKWSLYFKTMMEIAFEHYKITDAEVKMTDNTVILKIKSKH